MNSDTAPSSPFANGAPDLTARLVCPIDTPAEAVLARRQVAALAQSLRFSALDTGILDVVVLELVTNVRRYARCGALSARVVAGASGPGIQLDCVDRGPGITNLDHAMQDGYSTGGGYGSGLPAVRRLMDAFDMTSGPSGTRVTTCKWPTRQS